MIGERELLLVLGPQEAGEIPLPECPGRKGVFCLTEHGLWLSSLEVVLDQIPGKGWPERYWKIVQSKEVDGGPGVTRLSLRRIDDCIWRAVEVYASGKDAFIASAILHGANVPFGPMDEEVRKQKHAMNKANLRDKYTALMEYLCDWRIPAREHGLALFLFRERIDEKLLC